MKEVVDKLHPLPGLFAFKKNPLGRYFRFFELGGANPPNLLLTNQRGVIGCLNGHFGPVLKETFNGAREISDVIPEWNFAAVQLLPDVSTAMIGLMKTIVQLRKSAQANDIVLIDRFLQQPDASGTPILINFSEFYRNLQSSSPPLPAQPWSYQIGRRRDEDKNNGQEQLDGTFRIKDIVSECLIFESVNFSRFRRADAYGLYGRLLLETVHAVRDVSLNPDAYRPLKKSLATVARSRSYILEALESVANAAQPTASPNALSSAQHYYQVFSQGWEAMQRGPSIKAILAMDPSEQRPAYLRSVALPTDEVETASRPVGRLRISSAKPTA